jgi:hypothetical protein
MDVYPGFAMNTETTPKGFDFRAVVPQNEQQAAYLSQGAALLQAQPGTPDSQLLGIGAAGSGKSYLNMALVAAAVDRGLRVVCATPTHKALTILQRSARQYGISHQVTFCTIQSLLGLRLSAGENGKELQPVDSPTIGWYDLMLADEGSMINQAVWNFMRPYLGQTRFLGTGDPAQLYPVGEGLSPFFKSGMNQVKLTQPIRQAEGPLMDVVTAARRAVTAKKRNYAWFKPDRKAINTDGTPMRVSRKALVQAVLNHIDRIKDNPDTFRIVAFRNATVDQYNRVIRRAVLGPDAPQYAPGDRLLAKDRGINSPDGKETLVHTAMEMEVLEAEATHLDGYAVWKLRVIVEGDRSPITIYALHHDDQARFEQECQDLKAAALRNRFLWRRYYEHLEKFPNLKPCYALTVHYSQGGTYQHCGVDGKDLEACRHAGNDSPLSRARFYNRLWYVGLSRAAQNGYFVL